MTLDWILYPLKNDLNDITGIMDKYKVCIIKVTGSVFNFLNFIAVLGSRNIILVLWKYTQTFKA